MDVASCEGELAGAVVIVTIAGLGEVGRGGGAVVTSTDAGGLCCLVVADVGVVGGDANTGSDTSRGESGSAHRCY